MRIRKFNEAEEELDNDDFGNNQSSPDLDKLKKLEDSFNEIRTILIDFEDDNIIEYYQPGYSYRFSKDADFLEQIIKIQDDSDKQYHSKDTWKIKCEIKTSGYNGIISSVDFNILEDVMVAVKRIESTGYKCELKIDETTIYNSSYSVIVIKIDIKKDLR